MDLKTWLYNERISVTDFAKKIGYTRNYISQVTLGYKKPSQRLALVIEKATGKRVSARSLLSNNPNTSTKSVKKR